MTSFNIFSILLVTFLKKVSNTVGHCHTPCSLPPKRGKTFKGKRFHYYGQYYNTNTTGGRYMITILKSNENIEQKLKQILNRNHTEQNNAQQTVDEILYNIKKKRQ